MTKPRWSLREPVWDTVREDQLGERLLYRDDKPSLEVVELGRPWFFDGNGDHLRLVLEGYRINLASLFDPNVAEEEGKRLRMPGRAVA